MQEATRLYCDRIPIIPPEKLFFQLEKAYLSESSMLNLNTLNEREQHLNVESQTY